MTIESALYSYLSNKAAITALVSTRVYPHPAPDSAAYPFITYSLLNEEQDHAMGGAVGLANPSMQIDVWADTVSDRVDVSEAVRNALDGFRGNMGAENLNIRNCFLDNRSNFNENDGEGKTPIYRSSMDFSIWHVETVPTL